MSANNNCESKKVTVCSNGYIIVLVIYILLSIILFARNNIMY